MHVDTDQLKGFQIILPGQSISLYGYKDLSGETCGKFQLASETQITKLSNTSTCLQVKNKPQKGSKVEVILS